MTTFQISIEFSGEGGDRERELTSPIPRSQGVHSFAVNNPFTSETLIGFAAVSDIAKVSFHWEESEAFDALLHPQQADFIWIGDDGVAWEE